MVFVELFKSFIQQTLNEISQAFIDSGNLGYPVDVSLNNSYTIDSGNDICCNLVCGGDGKIDGAKESSFVGFSMHVFAERNTNGITTKKIFDLFFERYSMKSVTIIDPDDENIKYSCFLNFTNSQLVGQREQCEGGFRNKYTVVGSVIYSTSNEVGRHTYIAFPNSTTTDANATWYEIDPISPNENMNYNNDPQQVAGGLMVIPGIKGNGGSIHLVYKNDTVSDTFMDCIHGISDIKKLWIKTVYSHKTYTDKKLVVDSIDATYDDNSRHTVLTITYRKDDVNGI